MGQNLSEPKTEKKTESFENNLFAVGSSCMQGWRLGIIATCVFSSRVLSHVGFNTYCNDICCVGFSASMLQMPIHAIHYFYLLSWLDLYIHVYVM